MKALTLIQPWATLVAIGAKHIETRSWPTQYRGPLAIHAAKGFPRYAQNLCCTPVFWDALDKGLKRDYPGLTKSPTKFLPLGAVVAVCKLKDVVKIPPGGIPITIEEFAFGDYTPGRYAWILEDVRGLDVPVPAKGMLGLWEWTKEDW